jgi:iron uptake system component EfeO
VPKLLPVAALPLLLLACSSAPPDPGGAPAKTDAEHRREAVQGLHDAYLTDLETLISAVKDLQARAPAPADRGWDAASDAQAIAAMRADWVRARTAYEHVEGALAPLFPDIDASIDARYDDFLTMLAAQGGDQDLFDGTGVTGLHAVERILYADVAPARVVAFERSLPGYVPAAFPATAAEAAAFKTQLCAKLVADAEELAAQWTPADIDEAIAFQGLISLMGEQREKVDKAASNEEESRYCQRTMADLRDNLAGARAAYAFFRPWIASKPGGERTDAAIQEGFTELDGAYAEVPSDSIPEPPATWSAERPTPADLETPFGRLYTTVRNAVDATSPGSVVSQMNVAASSLGFPEFGMGR